MRRETVPQSRPVASQEWIMIKCQVCAYDNKDDAEYCLNCGSPLVKQKLSQAMDDVSDEATVLIDPAAMQKRIQDEINKEREGDEKPQEAHAVSPPSAGPPASAPAPPVPAASPAPPPPAAAPSYPPVSSAAGASDKDWAVTLVFALLLGMLGIHRFYVGKVGTGILQLITFGGCGIWQLIDIIFIVMGKFTDANGNAITQNG